MMVIFFALIGFSGPSRVSGGVDGCPEVGVLCPLRTGPAVGKLEVRAEVEPLRREPLAGYYEKWLEKVPLSPLYCAKELRCNWLRDAMR